MATELDQRLYDLAAKVNQRLQSKIDALWQAGGIGAVLRNIRDKLRESVDAQDYGADDSGLSDAAPAILLAAQAVSTSWRGGMVRGRGKFLIASNLSLPDGVKFKGVLVNPDERSGHDYQNEASVLIIDPAATITTGHRGGVSGFVAIKRNLNLPFADATTATAGVAAFSGTAITVGGQGCYLSDLLLLGFNQGIASSTHERVWIDRVKGDCTNGIWIDHCTDISRIRSCHFWPFITTHSSWTTDALLTRTGVAYKFTNIGDWNSANECFSFGYANGFVVDSCDHVILSGCGTDYPGALSSTSVGFTVQGTARNTTLLGCRAAAQGTGVLVNTTSSLAPSVTITAGDFWDNDIQHIHVQQGRAIVTGGNQLSGGIVGILVDPGSLGVLEHGNVFTSVTTPISASGSGLERSTFGSSQFIGCVDNQGQRELFDNQSATKLRTFYGTSATAYTVTGRTARGSVGSPTISQANDQAIRYFGHVFDGTVFSPVGCWRLQADGAPSAGATPGKFIISTTASGASAITDRWVIDSVGDFYPATDQNGRAGTPIARLAGVHTLGVTITELAAASVSTPTTGQQSLFIDTADHKLKRKDASGTVTIIA